MSSEARITELENEASALRKQVIELRNVLVVELDRIRTEIQTQLNEAKQLLLSRESESMTRVVQLEAEVVKLTLLCEQGTHKEELISSLSMQQKTTATEFKAEDVKLGSRAKKTAFPINTDGANEFAHEKNHSFQLSTAVGPPTNRTTTSVSSAIGDLQGRLRAVYTFYTATSAANATLLHPAMRLSNFTTMVRDAGLCSGRRPVPPELLWMAVLRSLSPASSQPERGRRLGSTLLHPRIYDGNTNSEGVGYLRHKDVFAWERLQYITQAQFSEALYVVYRTAFPHKHDLSPSTEQFRRYLLDTFLPAVEQRIHRRESRTSPYNSTRMGSCNPTTRPPSPEATVAFSAASSAHPIGEPTPNFGDVSATYDTDGAVKKLVRQFTPHLKRAFRNAIQCPTHRRVSETRMNLAAFAECIRQHNLLPLVPRSTIKAVFLFSLTAQPDACGAIADECITYESFITAMYCLAEQVYGSDPALLQQYPSPRARLSKLFVKMFVL